MRRFIYVIIFLSMPQVLLAADVRNDIPSCYQSLKINSPDYSGKGRNLIVAIDETVSLPKDLQNEAYQKIIRFSRPGDKIYLYKFSAYLAGRYFSMPFAGRLEQPLQGRERNNTSMVLVKQLDKCIESQLGYFKKTIGKSMLSSFGPPDVDIAKSEIFSALQQIGKDLSTHDKSETVVFLISDMLENSAFTSFYSNQKVKEINVQTELNVVVKSKLSANLKGARVFVLGAGLVSHNVPHGYRSAKTIQLLESFWSEYFQMSDATLMAFGAPELTIDLQ